MTDADLGHPAFEEIIQPGYAHLIKEVRPDYHEAEKQQYSMAAVLRALSRIPGPFECVELPDLSALAPSDSPMTSTAATRREELASYVNATRIIRAVFGRTARIVVVWSAPRILQLCGGTPIKELDVVANDVPTVAALLRALRECTALSTLTLHLGDGAATQAIEPGFTYSRLKKLSVSASDFTPFLRHFVSLFATSLEHLNLDLESTSTTSTCASQAQPVFPKLQQLDFDGAPAIALKIIENPLLTALPSLRHLSIAVPTHLGQFDLSRALSHDLQKALDVFAATASVPLEVSVRYKRYGITPDVVLPTDLTASAPVRLVPFVSDQPSRYSPDPALREPARYVQADGADLDKSLRAVEESLDAMRDQAKWARITGDRVQLAQIAETLQEWEGLRYNWRV